MTVSPAISSADGRPGIEPAVQHSGVDQEQRTVEPRRDPAVAAAACDAVTNRLTLYFRNSAGDLPGSLGVRPRARSRETITARSG